MSWLHRNATEFGKSGIPFNGYPAESVEIPMHFLCAEFFEQGLVEPNSGEKILQGKILVRGMRAAIRQCKTEKEDFDSENVFERIDNRNATAFANECELAIECPPEGTLRRGTER
jgi:hypothetical protein